jgi:hypothetical protein
VAKINGIELSLVGNYLDQDFSILEVDGTTITNTGKRAKVIRHLHA